MCALAEIESELGCKLTVAKVDVDSSPTLESQQTVRGIPTLIGVEGPRA